MIIEGIYNFFAGGKIEDELAKQASIKGLDYDEIKKDADSGIKECNVSFGKKYALARWYKTPSLIIYEELFWVFCVTDDDTPEVEVHMITLLNQYYKFKVSSQAAAREIYDRIREADSNVLLGFKDEYADIYNEHSHELKKVKLYWTLKQDIEERKKNYKPVEKESEPEPIEETVAEAVEMPETDTNTAENSEIPEKFAELHSLFLSSRQKTDNAEIIDQLIADGKTDMAEELKKYRVNSVQILYKETPEGGIPVGASKMGGYPDLPPEVDYPRMTGYTLRRKGQSASEAEVQAESAMHLVMQLNLYELAESGADIDELFPKTGMLYIFWSGECDNDMFTPNDYYFIRTDDPKLEHIQKVIWWDGDMSTLRRTAPPIPYPENIFISDGFDERCPENMIDFECYPDFKTESADEIEGLEEALDIDRYDLVNCDDKLLGIPQGGNCPYLAEDEVQLLQLDYNDGCLWKLYWIMKKSDLQKRDFSGVYIESDCD
ncbi:MAG: DUF1963 domain-containing protein [Ruminococcus sp.]|nr:DUF1963 domain-containing protein [Ruminococcus sp.]